MASDNMFDDWLEEAYEDRNGDPHGLGSPDAQEWSLPDVVDPECDQCAAPAGEPCYADCPYVKGL